MSFTRARKRKIALLSAAGVAVLALVSVVALYLSKLNLIQYDNSSGVSVDPNVSIPAESEDFGDLPSGPSEEPETPAGDVYKNPDLFNILLLGTDERVKHFSTDARADSIMLLSLNKKTGGIKLVSISRAMGVPVPGRDDDWFTHSFRYGGANLMLQTMRECMKVDVNRYVRVNFATFEKIFDAVGGVDIELTELEAKALNNEVYTNAVTRKRVKPGLNHLDGYDALQYSRLRFIDSDWQRVVRQRKTLEAAAVKMRKLSIPELNKFADEVLPLVQTNLTKGEITSLLLQAPKFASAKIEQKTVPEKGTYWHKLNKDGRSLFGVDFKEQSEKMQKFLTE